jgi:predicted acyltransferase
VIRLPLIGRAVAGLALLAVYQLLLDRLWLADVIAAPHNGPWGALNWGALLILATVLADLYHGDARAVREPERARRAYPWAGLAVLGAGLALAIVVPVSKHRASASFVLVSLGLSALVFYGFRLLNERTSLRPPVLGAWGRNALLLYLLHGVVIGFFALPAIPTWYVEAPWLLIVAQAAALLGILSAIGLYLDRRKAYWTL